MSVFVTLLSFAVAVGVCGVVGMGMAGKGKERHPVLADRFARAARALNGDGEVPPRFEKQVEKLVSRRR